MNYRKVRPNKNSTTDDYAIALLIHPDQPTLHKNVGSILASQGNYVRAQRHLQQALHLNSQDTVNHRNFAKVLH